MRLVVARAFGVGLVHGEAEAGTGHEVIEGAVVARGMMHAIGRDAAQARLLGDLDQLVQQGGCIGQAVVLQLHVDALRTEGVGVAARGLHSGLASAREQEPHAGFRRGRR